MSRFVAVMLFLIGSLLVLFAGNCLVLIASEANAYAFAVLGGIIFFGCAVCYGAVEIWKRG